MQIKRLLTMTFCASAVLAQTPTGLKAPLVDSDKGGILRPVMGGDGGGSTEDVNCAGKVVCPVGTIVTFNTSRMNIPFKLATIEDGSINAGAPMAFFAEPFFEQMSNTLNSVSQGSVYDRVMAVKNYYDNVQNMASAMQSGETVYFAYATMVASVVYAVADLFARENIRWRGYSFHVPVAANYSITCQLKGGWDKPRNRVVLNGAGAVAIDYQEQLVSDRPKNWQVRLEPGYYYLSVGLGSGTSNVFHTAGSLSSVILSESSPVTFQVPMVLASKTISVEALMPYPGATTTVTVRLPTQSEVDAIQFPNLLDGSKPSLTPAMPLLTESGPDIPLLYRQLLETGSNYCFRFTYPYGVEAQGATIGPDGVEFHLRNDGPMMDQQCSRY